MWRAVQILGFTGGTVIEPGCGKGSFIGLAPEGANFIGVELDPTTARIAQALYPQANIRPESFADSRIGGGTADLVIGNVPFGAITLHDVRHNPAKHAIHNHFIIKGLHLLRPGGLLAVITSRYTMDAVNPAARREMAELADLVGAVRLPSGAHRQTAGTDVVTDLLVLRRRASHELPRGIAFERSETHKTLDLRINEYFLRHPEHVLGTLQLGQGEGGRPELKVHQQAPTTPALAHALAAITKNARDRGLTMTTRLESEPVPAPAVAVQADNQQPAGYLLQTGDTFSVVAENGTLPHAVPRTQTRELSALLKLRTTLITLLEAEAASANDDRDSDQLDPLRRELNRRYDHYLSNFGPINRYTVRRTGKVDPETGEERHARVRPPQGAFRTDPFAPVVYALENFDDATQTASKTAIFSRRVLARRAPRLGADTPEDALAICLDTKGQVELDEVARLLGCSTQEARTQLGTLVFDEPETHRLVPAAEYLSGNVRKKLRAAEAAAESDARFAANVKSLSEVQPRDLGPAEIHAQLGSAWVSDTYVQQFLRETLEDQTIRAENPYGSLWAVKSERRHNVKATSVFGTPRCNAVDIAQALLEQRPIRVYDTDDDGNREFNATESLAATEKGAELTQRFAEWLWEDPKRTVELVRKYNDTFNALVPRDYNGERPSLPGLALNFTPRPHQLAAVAQCLYEPTVGVFHEVGAGKTATMIMSTMKKRQLGMIQKAAIVVPNHMLDQFTRDWLALYPRAKVLAAAKEDLRGDNRRRFVARCATGDWDAVIMTRSAFERIPVSPQTQKDYMQQEVEQLRRAYQAAEISGKSLSLKRLERLRLRREERLKALLDSTKDPGLTFEQMGIDHLVVDEFHAYKNLELASAIPGMLVPGSNRASDMHQKLWYLREVKKQKSVAVVATGTPIANSISEAYTMQRFLRPDLLRDAGIDNFDRWAATFGETVTGIEVTPDGSGVRMHSRFAKFHNVPELMLLWSPFANIRTAADLQLPVPALAPRPSDGTRAPEVLVVQPSDELSSFVQTLGQRADRVRSRSVSPDQDNMLAITTAGRAAALDLRLLEDLRTAEPQKIDIAADRIAAVYHDNRERTYPAGNGSTHPAPGALQLVFSDLGTPKPDQWNIYDALRDQLARRGIPRDRIRFIHEARNDREKANLFAACRQGQVAVLIGSTERMGVGTNVQHRAIALHHLDCPWRPADLTQREGRILRQGNHNPEIQIYRYVTEGSFDAYLWQTVARKAKFIEDIMRPRHDQRDQRNLDGDLGETSLSYEEVKALATGNPLLLEHAQCAADLNRLQRLERAHHQNQAYLQRTIIDTESQIQTLTQQLASTEALLARLQPPYHLTLNGHHYNLAGQKARSHANETLKQALDNYAERLAAMPKPHRAAPTELGTVNGEPFTARPSALRGELLVGLETSPSMQIKVEFSDLQKKSPQLVQRMLKQLAAIPDHQQTTAARVKRLQTESQRAHAELGRPFRLAGELGATRRRLATLDERITSEATPSPPVDDRSAARELSDDIAPAVTTATESEDLVSRELTAIQTKAKSLQSRLRAREKALTETLNREASVARDRRWPRLQSDGAQTDRQQRLSGALRRVRSHQLLLHDYSREPLQGYPTKGHQLARKRAARAAPGPIGVSSHHLQQRRHPPAIEPAIKRREPTLPRNRH